MSLFTYNLLAKPFENHFGISWYKNKNIDVQVDHCSTGPSSLVIISDDFYHLLQV